eukprot:7383926-Prymnesium_polylepis.1
MASLRPKSGPMWLPARAARRSRVVGRRKAAQGGGRQSRGSGEREGRGGAGGGAMGRSGGQAGTCARGGTRGRVGFWCPRRSVGPTSRKVRSAAGWMARATRQVAPGAAAGGGGAVHSCAGVARAWRGVWRKGARTRDWLGDARQRLARVRQPAAPAVEERRALAQVDAVELLLASEAHPVAHLAAHVCPLVDAPVPDEVLVERLRVERVGRGELLHLGGVERALPERNLGDVALEVVRRRVPAQVGAQHHRRRQVGLLRAACDMRRLPAVNVDPHEVAVVGADDRVPLVERDHVGRRHDPRRHLALEDDVPLR